MTPESPIFQFRSDLFAVDPREDEETNPFCYGRSLAEWVRGKFTELGYQPESIVPEDWGWCVVLRRSPFMLWVGCGNVTSELLNTVTPEQKESFVPDGSELTWSCLVGSDVPIWTTFFWQRLLGRAQMHEQVSVVSQQLEKILRDESRILIVTDGVGA